MLRSKLCSDLIGKKSNNFSVAVLFDVDYSTMGEFEGQTAVTVTGAVPTATETESLVCCRSSLVVGLLTAEDPYPVTLTRDQPALP